MCRGLVHQDLDARHLSGDNRELLEGRLAGGVRARLLARSLAGTRGR